MPPSDKQLARNELFRLASAYGNHVKTDPILAAEYRLLCRGRMRPYHAAVRDFMTPPKVNAIVCLVCRATRTAHPDRRHGR